MVLIKTRHFFFVYAILCIVSLVVYIGGLFNINSRSSEIKRENKKNSIFENIERQFKPNSKSIIDTISSSFDHNSHYDNNTPKEQWCKLPYLDIDSPSVSQFFRVKPRSIDCTSEKNWIKLDDDGRLVIEPEAIAEHGEIDCRLCYFWRVGNDQNSFGSQTKLQPGQKLESDFAEVKCIARGNGRFSNRLATVVPLKNAMDRASKESESELPRGKRALGLDVFMFGFDGTSRLTFMRNLPQTFEYLTENMDAIVLEGYNIVGDGTPQALIPMFTGKTELELPSTRKEDKDSSSVDVYPWIWKEFEKAGYVTLYSEDTIRAGAFELRLNGFKEQPTDHFIRTYYFDNPNDGFCEGSEQQYKTFFGYGKRFWRAYPKERKFAFQFNSIYSHEDYNLISLMDGYMVDYLKFIHQHLNDTILIVMADHGARFGKLRQTEQGKLEERLPFFSFAFPPWFKETYPRSYQSFKSNAKRLTTPFDIHATLKEILDFRAESNQDSPIEKNRQLSLFRPISADRTCSDAGIEPHWCTCLRWTDVPVDQDTIVRSIVHEFVSFANRQTQTVRNLCSELKLDHVISARKYSSNPLVLKYRKNSDRHGFVADLSDNTKSEIEFYQLDVLMQQGNARYQFTVKYGESNVQLQFDLTSITRADKYGDQPDCIRKKYPRLLIWCVCRDKQNL